MNDHTTPTPSATPDPRALALAAKLLALLGESPATAAPTPSPDGDPTPAIGRPMPAPTPEVAEADGDPSAGYTLDDVMCNIDAAWQDQTDADGRTDKRLDKIERLLTTLHQRIERQQDDLNALGTGLGATLLVVGLIYSRWRAPDAETCQEIEAALTEAETATAPWQNEAAGLLAVALAEHRAEAGDGDGDDDEPEIPAAFLDCPAPVAPGMSEHQRLRRVKMLVGARARANSDHHITAARGDIMRRKKLATIADLLTQAEKYARSNPARYRALAFLLSDCHDLLAEAA